MEFPDIVKYAREKFGMSQEELASALKTSFSTINRWENGKTHPNKMAKHVFFDYCVHHGFNAEEMLRCKHREE